MQEQLVENYVLEIRHLRSTYQKNKSMSNIKNITCGYETCISSMLLQSYLNKWRISQLSKLNKVCINSASTQLLKNPIKFH